MVVAEIDGENEFCFGAQQVKYMPPQRVNPHPRLQQLLERLEECKEEEEEEEEEALTACYPSFFMKVRVLFQDSVWILYHALAMLVFNQFDIIRMGM